MRSVGAIDEEAITSLAFIADLTKHIHTRVSAAGGDGGDGGGGSGASAIRPTSSMPSLSSVGSTSEEDGSAFHSFFPSFLWVLRDFVLDIVDEVGGARTCVSCAVAAAVLLL